MNFPHVRTGRRLTERERGMLSELIKAQQMSAGGAPPISVPANPRPRPREVRTAKPQPVPTSRQRQALKAAIIRGGWQGKIAPSHLDALWRRLPDLGLEHDPASNSIRPQQAAPLQGGRPRTKRAADSATRGLVIQQHMREGHLATFTTAQGERSQGSIVAWGRHGATLRTTDGQALAVPYTVMSRVEPPPEPQPGPTSPARRTTRKSRPALGDLFKAALDASPEVLG